MFVGRFLSEEEWKVYVVQYYNIRRYFKHADNLKSVLVLSKIIKIGATR